MDRGRRVTNTMIRKSFLGLALLVLSGIARADWALNMPKGVTELSAETYNLHMLIYSLIMHRQSKGAKPAQFSHSTTAEVIWTAIPCLILLFMAIPAAETMIKLEDSRDPDMSIVVTGYQWKWHYRYQNEDVGFYSNLARESVEARPLDSGIDPFSVDNYLLDVDEPMVVPVGAKVRLLITANDVIHSWWVPELAIKKDAIPGIINETWFKAEQVGTYRGKCTELCGKDHGYMPVVVEVVEPEAYQAWLDTRTGGNQRYANNELTATPDAALAAGE